MLGTDENSLSSAVPNSHNDSTFYVVNDRPEDSTLLNLLVMESNANEAHKINFDMEQSQK